MHKKDKLSFFPLNTISIFLDDLQRFAEEMFDNIAEAQTIIEEFSYHQILPHLKRPVNRTDSKMEATKKNSKNVNGLEAADEPALAMSTRKKLPMNLFSSDIRWKEKDGKIIIR